MFLYEYLVFYEVISQRTYVSFVNGKSQKLYNDVTSRLEELFQAASDDPKSSSVLQFLLHLNLFGIGRNHIHQRTCGPLNQRMHILVFLLNKMNLGRQLSILLFPEVRHMGRSY